MSAHEVTAEELGALRLFENLGQAMRASLAATAAHRRLADGETLYAQGGDPRELFVVLRGRLALHVADGGRSTMVQSVHAPDVLGWSALREDPHWLTTARAIGPVEVVALPLAAILDAIEAGGPDARRLVQRLFGVGAAHLDAVRQQLQQPSRETIITGG
jgi:CRP-like cAMP-binding protein